MGSCVSLKKSDAGNLIRPFIKPPPINKTNNLSEMNQILYKFTKCDDMILWDEQYDLITEEDIKNIPMEYTGTIILVQNEPIGSFFL